MVDLSLVFQYTDWASALLLLVAIYYILRIAKVTGWFGAWAILTVAFVGILIRRILAAYAPMIGSPAWLGQLNSAIQLVLSILYIIAFFMLYKLFKGKQNT